MISLEQMSLVLEALPDPAFLLSRTGRYVAVYGGRDTRYYHDSSSLVGMYISDIIAPDKADWFLEQIARALESRKLLVAEYELGSEEVDGLPEGGPTEPIWFEGRIQALNFLVDDEEVVLWVASNISERHSLELQLRELGDTDQLTGLFNRRRLEHDLALRYESFTRYQAPTSVVMFDLDGLKAINDTEGHHAGDEVIRAVAAVCRKVARKVDKLYRYGGDEFVVALPDTGREQALCFSLRLQESFRRELGCFVGDGAGVTASIGITAIGLEDGSFHDTLKRADRALYDAKGLGKDRVVAS